MAVVRRLADMIMLFEGALDAASGEEAKKPPRNTPSGILAIISCPSNERPKFSARMRTSDSSGRAKRINPPIFAGICLSTPPTRTNLNLPAVLRQFAVFSAAQLKSQLTCRKTPPAEQDSTSI